MTLAFLALLGAPYIYEISSLRVKHPSPSGAEVKNEWGYSVYLFSSYSTSWRAQGKLCVGTEYIILF